MTIDSIVNVEIDDDNKGHRSERIEEKDRDYEIKYNDRKPRWWKQLSSYSRRGSKAQQRAYQTMQSHKLPSIKYGEMHDFDKVFETSKSKAIWLEIGCGQGDNLLANAEFHPDIAMIGADVHKPSVGLSLLRIKKAIQDKEYWRDYNLYSPSKDPCVTNEGEDGANPSAEAGGTISCPDSKEDPYSNARIFPGDGIKLLRYIPNSSLSVLMITFPDPFYKERYKEHRVLQSHTILDIHRVLKPGGRFHVATDHPVFYEWVMKLMEQTTHLFNRLHDQSADRISWLPVISKYEQKGWSEERKTFLLSWETVKENVSGDDEEQMENR
mmetsp:Transcript_31524/g.46521  ORF Transcript_31524/g.46521 Transcript_31524/m.46521 type:complete len:325 (+) Transcript_31524:120-1094(+)